MRIDPAGLSGNTPRTPGTPTSRTAEKLSDSSMTPAEAGGFLPTSELAGLLSAVSTEPDIRSELLRGVLERLQSGELNSPEAAMDTARALIEMESPLE